MSGLPANLSTDQAPPLSIPSSFFAMAPVAMIAAGILLLVLDAPLLARSMPATIALTHLGTLGLLGCVMFGALYQMIPVVAGAPVPAPRLAHLVQLGLLVGLALLEHGVISGARWSLSGAVHILGPTFALFLGPVGWAIARAPTRSDAVRGMRLALLALFCLVALGILLAIVRFRGLSFLDPQSALGAHLVLGLLVWIGGLIASVSFEIIPMFYLTEAPPSWASRTILLALFATLITCLGGLALGLPLGSMLWLGAPAALAIWLLHPILTLRAIRRRRRRRVDASVRYWIVGLALAPLTLASGVAAAWLTDPRFPLLFGWLAIWGWAALIIHGMLGRIVPFLVWFHRFSPFVGLERVPSMRELLPDRRLHLALGLHLLSLLLGIGAILSTLEPLRWATGVALILTGLALGQNLLHVLTRTHQQANPTRPAT